jgi:hypothetical protein
VIDLILPPPRGRKGRPTKAETEEIARCRRHLVEVLREMRSRTDFSPGARGWCYLLEQDGGYIDKGQFDLAEKEINICRECGMLPINFCSEDTARAPDYLEDLDDDDPKEHAKQRVKWVSECWKDYSPLSFWEFQPVYFECWVEKVDLKSLFGPVCKLYHVPLANAKGWSDFNMRLNAMLRFKYWEAKGKRVALLYGGDWDPPGVKMSEKVKGNMAKLAGATYLDDEGEEVPIGWSPDNLVVDRFCLNRDFIDRHDLPWIDGLKSGDGKDLALPRHHNHYIYDVPEWLRTQGNRKVEANALVIMPAEARKLCLRAFLRHLDLDGIKEWESETEKLRRRCKGEIARVMRRIARGLSGRNGPPPKG